ncbi:hypothetical protein EsH8_I_000818 [Colletotrichum jinshuiense]
MVTYGSDEAKLLTDVYSHIAEYVATKEQRHLDEAVGIVEQATKSNPAPWISTDNLERFLQKRPLRPFQAEKAIEEFFTSVPESPAQVFSGKQRQARCEPTASERTGQQIGKDKEEREQFISRLNELPGALHQDIFMRTMLRCYQSNYSEPPLEALENTIEEEKESIDLLRNR